MEKHIIYRFKKYLCVIFIYLNIIDKKTYNYITNIVNKKIGMNRNISHIKLYFHLMFVGLNNQIIIVIFILINTQK